MTRLNDISDIKNTQLCNGQVFVLYGRRDVDMLELEMYAEEGYGLRYSVYQRIKLAHRNLQIKELIELLMMDLDIGTAWFWQTSGQWDVCEFAHVSNPKVKNYEHYRGTSL